MAENISSQILFHFTKSMADLKSILKDGFYPHYCPEYSLHADDKRAARQHRHPGRASAMVCFCDLPLSLIRKHRENYGKFAIGLRKEWGIRNGVAPVIYTHSRAQTRRPMLRLTVTAPPKTDGISAHDLDLLAAYTKPYLGPAWRNRRYKPGVKFYDEREWRYVPATDPTKPLFLDWKDYSNDPKRAKIHKRFKQDNALPIDPDDIQYLIIPYDKEENNILELHAYITTRYRRKDAILITTAIMTDDCLTQDI
jgi:hypothetical protein